MQGRIIVISINLFVSIGKGDEDRSMKVLKCARGRFLVQSQLLALICPVFASSLPSHIANGDCEKEIMKKSAK